MLNMIADYCSRIPYHASATYLAIERAAGGRLRVVRLAAPNCRIYL